MRLIPGLAALALVATPVLAQTTSQTPRNTAPPSQTDTGKPDPYHATLDQRIARMKQRLAITPAQEPAWNDFTGVMRKNADTIQQSFHDRADHLKTMTAAENLHEYATIEQGRAEGVQRLASSFDTLYGQLNDQQKQAADAMFRQYQLDRQQRGTRR